METIFHRVSIRKFEDRPVEAEKMERLLRAAMAAPSAGNQQPWEFYVVSDKTLICALSQATPYAHCAKNASVVVVPCFRKECWAPSCSLLDLSAATENLLLEADYLGLGAVWMGVAPQETLMQRVREVLALPEHLQPFALVPCGYPAERREWKDRYDPSRVHYLPGKEETECTR